MDLTRLYHKTVLLLLMDPSVYMKDKSKVIYPLMDRQLHREIDMSRQKIFSIFHNMTEN